MGEATGGEGVDLLAAPSPQIGHLDNGTGAGHLKDLTGALGPVIQGYVHNTHCPKLQEAEKYFKWCEGGE